MTNIHTPATHYVIPIAERSDGSVVARFSSVGDITVQPHEDMLVLFSAGMEHVSVYVYSDITDILAWVARDQKHVKPERKTMIEQEVAQTPKEE